MLRGVRGGSPSPRRAPFRGSATGAPSSPAPAGGAQPRHRRVCKRSGGSESPAEGGPAPTSGYESGTGQRGRFARGRGWTRYSDITFRLTRLTGDEEPEEDEDRQLTGR